MVLSGGAVPPVPLEEVESAVRAALAAGSPDGLAVLGYGEISLVVGWPTDQPAVAAKRLPEFPSPASAARYGDTFTRYLDRLSRRGVVAVPSEFRTVTGPSGGLVGYVVQPVLAPATLGPEVLRHADPDPSHPLVEAICALVPEVLDERTGLDAQISNWALTAEGLRYLDVSTPMTFDDGRIEVDIDLFLAAYPWAVRAPIRHFVAPGVVGAYRDVRHVLVDLAANLLKERLEAWVPPVVEAANRLGGLDEPVTEAEVRRYYRSDARLWEAMLRLRRADRWWQRRVRRRDYPFLLPGPIRR